MPARRRAVKKYATRGGGTAPVKVEEEDSASDSSRATSPPPPPAKDEEELSGDEEEEKEKADLPYRFRFDSGLQLDHSAAVYGVSFSAFVREPSPPVLATAAGNRLTVFACPPSGGLTALAAFKDPAKEEEFYCVAWLYHPEAQRHVLAGAGLRGLIRLLHLPSQAPGASSLKLASTLIGHGHAVNELRVHPKHSVILASASQDYTVRLWDSIREATLAVVGGGDGHVDQVLSMDFNMDGSLLVSCSMDHSVKVWTAGPLPFTDQSMDKAIQTSLCSPSSTSQTVLQSPFPSGSTTDLHGNYVDCVRFLGKRHILSKSCDQSICLWRFGELHDQKLDPMLPGGKAETNVSLVCSLTMEECDIWFLRLGLSPDFRLLACGDKAGRVNVWPLQEDMGELAPVRLVHRKCRSTVRQVDFSPDGRLLVAVCDDATVWRWNVSPK